MYNLAAGPLEDLLVRHGAQVISEIEASANQDDLFLFVVSGVWTERMSPEIRDRVHALIDKAETRGIGPQGKGPVTH